VIRRVNVIHDSAKRCIGTRASDESAQRRRAANAF
jgi:hypothetical protein